MAQLPQPLVPKHLNNGTCPHCELIFRRYDNFHRPLWDWFIRFQKDNPEAHISCAGRGHLDQEEAFVKKTSKAHYGESAHNYNAAIDLFELSHDTANIYEREWFEKVLQPALQPWMSWYGREGSKYYELPHVEVAQWKAIAKAGGLALVQAYGHVIPFPEG